MRQHHRPTRLAFLLAAGFTLVAPALVFGAAPAGASCAAPATIPVGIARADVVVVGTVTATHSRGRIAEMRVVERWKGNVGSTFEVAGGPAADNTMTTVDRTYQLGTTYLLFAFAPALHHSPGSFGAALEDNACSNTQAWSTALARYRPASTAPASPRPADAPRHNAPVAAPVTHAGRSASDVWPWVLGASSMVALAVILVAFGMRAKRGGVAH